jgi:hypothetical protein
MNVFLLGLRVTASAQESDGTVNVLAEALPSNDKRVPTKVQLLQQKNHYVGKLLTNLQNDQTVLAIGPTRPTPDGVLQMQPMLVVTEENFSDLLAINLFIATGGLGPKADEIELSDTTVTNRSLAWQTADSETAWMKLTGWGELSSQLAELSPGTPTIAVGKVSTSEKDEKALPKLQSSTKFCIYPKSTKTAPKKAADPEKGKVTAAALGSIDFLSLIEVSPWFLLLVNFLRTKFSAMFRLTRLRIDLQARRWKSDVDPDSAIVDKNDNGIPIEFILVGLHSVFR